MLKRAIVGLLLLLSVGCEPITPTYIPDQCLRQQLFEKCLNLLPAGPQTTMYNDWDEVVKSCDHQSYYSSHRKRELIKPECH